jgi:hypothetical protein
MGLDGLASVAYGPDAALTVLMPLGDFRPPRRLKARYSIWQGS